MELLFAGGTLSLRRILVLALRLLIPLSLTGAYLKNASLSARLSTETGFEIKTLPPPRPTSATKTRTAVVAIADGAEEKVKPATEFPVPLKLPTPVIVVGFPKSETTSIWSFFNCSGMVAQRSCAIGDNKNHPLCEKGDMMLCIFGTLVKKGPLLEACGDYQVYPQIVGKEPTIREPTENETGYERLRIWNFLPQRSHLDKLHECAPNATYSKFVFSERHLGKALVYE